jgi:hypothetical protein
LDYRVEDAGDGQVRVKGCYKSDVPFGTIYVHTRMRTAEEAPLLERLVEVKDGLGAFDWLIPATEPILEVDPWGFILAYERTLSKTEKTACDTADPGSAN